MDSSTIQKYAKRSTPWLIEKASNVFNRFIRTRDEGQPCISCGKYTVLQCGHFYSGGHHPELRFNEDNCHGQCQHCNYFLSGNLNEYRKNLINKIGLERVEKLDFIVGITRQTGFKWNRISLIETIQKYSK